MNCPIKFEIKQTEESGKKFIKAMRRLRRSLILCDTCKLVDKCTIREEFNRQVDAVIEDVNEEWGMTQRSIPSGIIERGS